MPAPLLVNALKIGMTQETPAAWKANFARDLRSSLAFVSLRNGRDHRADTDPANAE